ncbi:hypothetical protein [Micromonospora sagamiensis]|uniref:Uncharacterized protein n=1 Tax=Micromonospora sagamiensis TaxID=47875 RepID=A0A562W9A6_9ACTN|nr:hypothetical protein [Micromonospora sagamiensis]TWJ26547.1 hypothetical protein JD81_00002 [Micromonospora sagamiensis]
MFPDLAANLHDETGMDVELERTSLLFLMYDEHDKVFARALWDDYPQQRSRFEWLTPRRSPPPSRR